MFFQGFVSFHDPTFLDIPILDRSQKDEDGDLFGDQELMVDDIWLAGNLGENLCWNGTHDFFGQQNQLVGRKRWSKMASHLYKLYYM